MAGRSRGPVRGRGRDGHQEHAGDMPRACGQPSEIPRCSDDHALELSQDFTALRRLKVARCAMSAQSSYMAIDPRRTSDGLADRALRNHAGRDGFDGVTNERRPVEKALGGSFEERRRSSDRGWLDSVMPRATGTLEEGRAVAPPRRRFQGVAASRKAAGADKGAASRRCRSVRERERADSTAGNWRGLMVAGDARPRPRRSDVFSSARAKAIQA